MREIEEALQSAEGLSDDTALGSIKFFLGCTLICRDAPAERHRGLELVTQVREMWLREQTRLYLVPAAEVIAAGERARRGDRVGAMPVMRTAVDDLFESGQRSFCPAATAVLVESLLDRGAEGDMAEAQAAIDRLANLSATEVWIIRDIWLLRLRALLARSIGDNAAYRDLVERYRAMAKSLGFEGHMSMANSMM